MALVLLAVLLLLAFFNSPGILFLLPALVILCREVLVSGLREYLAQVKVRLPVSRLAKWKTAIQMVAIGFLIVAESGPSWLPTTEIGLAGIWIAATLTLITGSQDQIQRSLRWTLDSFVFTQKVMARAGTATSVTTGSSTRRRSRC